MDRQERHRVSVWLGLLLGDCLQGDPNLVFPTGSWGSVRTTNIKMAVPSTPASVTYAWSVGDYGNCSALCGGGQQRRTVSCLDSFGNTAPAYACQQPAPPSNRSCQTQPCQASLPSGFALVLGDWGTCNSSCGYGSRTRSAMCISREGYVGSLMSCYATPAGALREVGPVCAALTCGTLAVPAAGLNSLARNRFGAIMLRVAE